MGSRVHGFRAKGLGFRVMELLGGFPNLGVFLWGPRNKDYNSLVSNGVSLPIELPVGLQRACNIVLPWFKVQGLGSRVQGLGASNGVRRVC